MIFDSWFDPYVGVVMLGRIFDGTFEVGDSIRMMATDVERDIQVQVNRMRHRQYRNASLAVLPYLLGMQPLWLVDDGPPRPTEHP